MSIKTKFKFTLQIFLITAVIVGITFLAYFPALENRLVWDSRDYLINNPYVTQLNLENIKWMFTTLYLSNWHPITWVSYALDFHFYDDVVRGLHLSNIIFHAVNSILVFFLALITLGLAFPDNTNHPIRLDHNALIAAFFAAVFFSAHPQHVESVAWVAERKDVLSFLFIAGVFLSYLQYVVSKQVHKSKWFVLTILFFILALLSKPMAVTVPAVLLIIDIYPIRRTPFLEPVHRAIKTRPYKQIFLEKLPFFALTICTIIITLNAQASSMMDVSLQLRILNAIDSIFMYIRKLFLPFNFSVLYPHPIHNSALKDGQNYIYFLFIFGFIACSTIFIALWIKKRYSWLSVWCFYLVTLSPVLGIIQVGMQSSADRYAYLPTLPVYLLIAAGIFIFLSQKTYRPRVFLYVICLSVSGFLVFETHKQSQVWLNPITLWLHAVGSYPDNAMAQGNLAMSYKFYGYDELALQHFEYAGFLGLINKKYLGAYAFINLKTGNYSRAGEIYKDLSISNKRKPILGFTQDCLDYNLGWSHAQLSEYEPAKAALVQIPKDSPEYDNAQQILTLMQSQAPIETKAMPNFCHEQGAIRNNWDEKKVEFFTQTE